jgi:sarcosine oxidase
VFEPTAGFLRVEQCVSSHLDLAVDLGADLRTGVEVHGWRIDGSGVIVETDQGDIAADRLVIAAGAWAGQILADLGLPLTVLRKPLFWFDAEPLYGVDRGCPVFFYDTPAGTFYGFPSHGDEGLKVARHSGGAAVADPLQPDRSLHFEDQQHVAEFLDAHLPGVSTDHPTAHVVCMYTSTPDGHFVVDRHRHHPQVSFVAGLSGQGFKMASAPGEILAGFALGEDPSPDIDFLRSQRFS